MEEGKKESYRVVWGFGPRALLTVEYSRKQQQWCIEQDRSQRGSKSIGRGRVLRPNLTTHPQYTFLILSLAFTFPVKVVTNLLLVQRG